MFSLKIIIRWLGAIQDAFGWRASGAQSLLLASHLRPMVVCGRINEFDPSSPCISVTRSVIRMDNLCREDVPFLQENRSTPTSG